MRTFAVSVVVNVHKQLNKFWVAVEFMRIDVQIMLLYGTICLYSRSHDTFWKTVKDDTMHIIILPVRVNFNIFYIGQNHAN